MCPANGIRIHRQTPTICTSTTTSVAAACYADFIPVGFGFYQHSRSTIKAHTVCRQSSCSAQLNEICLFPNPPAQPRRNQNLREQHRDPQMFFWNKYICSLDEYHALLRPQTDGEIDGWIEGWRGDRGCARSLSLSLCRLAERKFGRSTPSRKQTRERTHYCTLTHAHTQP